MKTICYVIGTLIFLAVFLISSVCLLTDNSCGTDRKSLEKRCVSAINHYRGSDAETEVTAGISDGAGAAFSAEPGITGGLRFRGKSYCHRQAEIHSCTATS